MSEAKRYATIHHPTIQAVLHEMYRLPDAQDAVHLLDTFKQHFIVGKKQIQNEAHPSVILWIKGYGVTEADKPKGVVGHYAVVTYKEIDGKFALYATKMDTDYRKHPQRALVVLKNQPPNWGHPVLRAVRKNKTYMTAEDAQKQLAQLHEQYPSISIPTPNKLYIMIYCSDRPATQRMVKHTLEIKTNDQGQFFIEIKENKPKVKIKPVTPVAAPQEPQGAFTAKVMLRRARKPKKANTLLADREGRAEN